MHTSTQKEIDTALKELNEALNEALKAQNTETSAKLARTKAHYRLSLAREAIRQLSFNE
jgi:ElaB/YqjD/DUF883 family membrane-anchored ribosome-binding protein